MVHIVGLVVDRPNIPCLFFGSIGHSVDQPLYIALDRSNGCLQVMGDIADQFPVLALVFQLLIGGFFQAQTHVLIVAVQVSDLSLLTGRKCIGEIAVTDIIHSDIDRADRCKNTSLQPPGEQKSSKNQDRQHRYKQTAHKSS